MLEKRLIQKTTEGFKTVKNKLQLYLNSCKKKNQKPSEKEYMKIVHEFLLKEGRQTTFTSIKNIRI